MKARTVIRRECREDTSVLDLLNEVLGDPMHSLYIEAKPGLEQNVLLFRINQLATKIGANLHTRLTPAGVWVRFPYPKFEATVQFPDEVRIALLGIEGEKRFCLLVRTTNEGIAELEAVEVSLQNSDDRLAPKSGSRN